MLPLCLAAAALKLTGPPSLSQAEVDQLVAQRTRLRSLRDFAAADALKETLESAGVRLQDEVRGRVDMYAAGRLRRRQWLRPQQPAQLECEGEGAAA